MTRGPESTSHAGIDLVPRLLNDADATIPGTDAFLIVDTTDPSTIDLDAIESKLRALLWPSESS